MKIAVMTLVYPSRNAAGGATPVIHYFAREWAAMGHDVTVYHLEARYPFFIYWMTRLFERSLTSKLGRPVPTHRPQEYDEVLDGVNVHHWQINRYTISQRYSKRQVDKIFSRICKCSDESGAPDLFIGHWDSPQLELLNMLRAKYPSARNALVLHNTRSTLRRSYGDKLQQLFKNIDIVGFRNETESERFSRMYFKPRKTFIAYSGVSSLFIDNAQTKQFDNGIHNYIYVGALIERKHPREVLQAVSSAYAEKDFRLTFVGQGHERTAIESYSRKAGIDGNVVLTGRLDREQIIQHLKQTDVFVMISESEAFGLVYLEAMALGCITIGSQGEGIDGVIVDGENGFLCNPADADNLKEILNTIRTMPPDELQRISRNAVNTALKMSDRKVAESYLDAVTK